jgi:hypothetical protein
VFVANPHKPPAIADILVNNRNKLLKYLEDFHTDRGETHSQDRIDLWAQLLLCLCAVLDSMPAQLHVTHRYKAGQLAAYLHGLARVVCCLTLFVSVGRQLYVAACDRLGLCCAAFCGCYSDEDEQFKEEKQTIIAAISKLGPSDAEPAAGQQQEQGHTQPSPTLPEQQQPAQGQQPEGAPAVAAGVDVPVAAAAAGQQQPDTEGAPGVS